MIKYRDYYVAFEEIPDEITVAVNITNCPNKCVGCHSPELRNDFGKELNIKEIDKIISDNKGITCFTFMGEGKDDEHIIEYANYISENYNLKTCIYSGKEILPEIFYKTFDYVKVGPYIAEYGPLNKETTNQRMYKVKDGIVEDITYRYWKRW